MVIVSPERTIWENQKDRASTNGKMAAFTLATSKMDSKLVKENGKSVSMTRIATCTRATTRTTRKTEWVCLPGSRATITRGATRMTNDTATVRCTGKMAPAIKANGTEASRTVWGAWSFPMGASKKATSKTTHSRDLRWRHQKSEISKRKRSF